MVKMLQQHIFLFSDAYDFLFEQLVVKELAYLETDLGILIRIKRSDPRLCGTERFSSKALFFISVKIFVIRHYHLCSVGDKDLRLRHTAVNN